MRYLIAFAAMLGLLFVVLLLLFHGGGSPKVPRTNRPLSSYADTDAQVRMTIDGPVNSDQAHQSVQITVDNDSVTFEQLRGYQGDVVKTQSFASNQNAYVNFLQALAHAGFTRGDSSAGLRDERGFCPLGDRYIFELTQEGTEIERYWITNCGGLKTYNGDPKLTVALFKAQIPNYADLVKGIGL